MGSETPASAMPIAGRAKMGHRRAQGQREGDRHPVEQLRPDRRTGDERVTEARRGAVLRARTDVVRGADEDALQPVPVLDVDRAVEAESLSGSGDLRGIGGPGDL